METGINMEAEGRRKQQVRTERKRVIRDLAFSVVELYDSSVTLMQNYTGKGDKIPC